MYFGRQANLDVRMEQLSAAGLLSARNLQGAV